MKQIDILRHFNRSFEGILSEEHVPHVVILFPVCPASQLYISFDGTLADCNSESKESYFADDIIIFYIFVEIKYLP